MTKTEEKNKVQGKKAKNEKTLCQKNILYARSIS